jgi:hypothetical protein
LSAHDQNQDEREKVFDPQSEPSVAGNKPSSFSQIFSAYNSNANTPVFGSDPIDPKDTASGHQSSNLQSDQRFEKPAAGAFTQVFGKGPIQPPSNEFSFNRQEQPATTSPSIAETPHEATPSQPGAFTRVFGKGDIQPQGQPNASPSPAFVQPDAFSSTLPRPSANPILFPEKDTSQPSSPVRGSFEERIAPAKPDGFSDIFQNPKQAAPDRPFPKFQGLGAPVIPTAAIPLGTQPSASTVAKRPSDDLFADERPNLNAVKLPAGPSDYTRIVNPSALRPSQESNGAPPSTPPASQVNASQAPQAYQIPQMVQMPQMQVQAPQMQMGQMQVPQIQAPQMTASAPMMQMPTVAPLPQPSLTVPPLAQPLAPEAANSKWAPYMPLIIALNVFLLLAMFLILIVFLATKK